MSTNHFLFMLSHATHTLTNNAINNTYGYFVIIFIILTEVSNI